MYVHLCAGAHSAHTPEHRTGCFVSCSITLYVDPRDRASHRIRREAGSLHASMILLSPSPRMLGLEARIQLFQDFYVGSGDSNSGPVLYQLSYPLTNLPAPRIFFSLV